VPLYEFEGKRPAIDPGAWVAPSADLIGDVRIGPGVYVGWASVLRGDNGTIIVEEGSAIEEGVLIHTSVDCTCLIGTEATIGHGAMLHNTTVEPYAVIGMRATLSNFSKVGRWSIIGEMGLVIARQEIPPEAIAVGQPVKVIGQVEERHKTRWTESKRRYQRYVERNRAGLKLME